MSDYGLTWILDYYKLHFLIHIMYELTLVKYLLKIYKNNSSEFFFLSHHILVIITQYIKAVVHTTSVYWLISINKTIFVFHSKKVLFYIITNFISNWFSVYTFLYNCYKKLSEI